MSAVFVVFFFCLHQWGQDYTQQDKYRDSCDEKLKEDSGQQKGWEMRDGASENQF